MEIVELIEFIASLFTTRLRYLLLVLVLVAISIAFMAYDLKNNPPGALKRSVEKVLSHPQK